MATHMDFDKIRTAVAARFAQMTKDGQTLFVTATTRDDIWATYLGSFPAGTDPIYRERTEHDCNCCKQFIRTVGNVVAIENGALVSIWDVEVDDANYQIVADAMAQYVKSKPIANTFLHYEPHAGRAATFEQLVGTVRKWDHFHVTIPKAYVKPKAAIAGILSAERSQRDVMFRALSEITIDAIDTVLDLISQNSLYRGEEHKHAVSGFRKLKIAFDQAATAEQREYFAWKASCTAIPAIARIRNTSIGTLLVDLSEGIKDMEGAVRSFEAMVAPANYKRPTALVTPKMVEAAKAAVAELGLTSSLERRYAALSDISINNILFADRSAKRKITGDVFDDIATQASRKKTLNKIEEVPIAKFLADIVPNAETIELLVENRHANNFVSLITAVDPTAKPLFKWNNPFSWSYAGDVTDVIKERVKAAGGNVTGDVCCRLAWFNYDDLDFHMHEPSGQRIYFGNRRSLTGSLDVDMNAGYGRSRTPVENIVYPDKQKMKNGTYILEVHQYNQRETTNVGFEVQIDVCGTVHTFHYDRPVTDRARHTIAKLHVKNGEVTVEPVMESQQRSKEVWDVTTETWQKVNVIMNSPNHWDGEQGIGNKHYFFMLDGCINDGTARGFYNEFLHSDLDKHRKVLEMVGSKIRTQETVNQLSGVGFSSTVRNNITVRVTGAFTRTIKVVF